jgi:ribosomal protein S18 acetylase RimI-like enzyme
MRLIGFMDATITDPVFTEATIGPMSDGAPPVQIRAAIDADIPDLATVQLRSALTGFAHIFPESIPKPTQHELEDEWFGLVSDRQRTVLAATMDGGIVGAIVFGPDKEPQWGTDCVVLKLYVVPSNFGQGIGSVLHDRAVASFRAENRVQARLWVLEHNTRARRMYERRGWVRRPWSRSDWPGSGIDEIGYVLDLI